jgi:hypothetical protein
LKSRLAGFQLHRKPAGPHSRRLADW